MTIKSLLLAASAALLLSAPVGLSIPAAAQTTAPAATAPAPKPQVQRTPKSLECSKLADERGLKGKERKKFRSACKKGKTPSPT